MNLGGIEYLFSSCEDAGEGSSSVLVYKHIFLFYKKSQMEKIEQ